MISLASDVSEQLREGHDYFAQDLLMSRRARDLWSIAAHSDLAGCGANGASSRATLERHLVGFEQFSLSGLAAGLGYESSMGEDSCVLGLGDGVPMELPIKPRLFRAKLARSVLRLVREDCFEISARGLGPKGHL